VTNVGSAVGAVKWKWRAAETRKSETGVAVGAKRSTLHAWRHVVQCNVENLGAVQFDGRDKAERRKKGRFEQFVKRKGDLERSRRWQTVLWVAEAKFEQSRENDDDDDDDTENRQSKQSQTINQANVTALGRCSSQTASNGVILSSTSWYTNVKFVRSRVVRKKKKDRN
jgi:hypothetical protein